MSANEPKKKVRVTGLKSLLIGGALFAIAVSCAISNSHSGATSPEPSLGTSTHTVTYSVSGTAATASVDYVKDDRLGQAQQDISVPWSVDVDMGDGVIGSSLIVQNKGEAGSVTCTITEDGKVVSTTTSSGAYVIATCTG